MKPKIHRFIPQNDPDQRVYFSRTELTAVSESAMRGSGEVVQNTVLQLLLEIPGVAVATVTPYALNVIKAPPFEWAEIEPYIARLIKALNVGEGRLEEEDTRNA